MEPESPNGRERMVSFQEPTEMLNQVEERVRNHLATSNPTFFLPMNLVEAAERQHYYYADQLVGVISGNDPTLIKQTKVTAILKNYEEALMTLGALVSARARSQGNDTSEQPGQWSQTRSHSIHLFRLLQHITGRLIPSSAVRFGRTQQISSAIDKVRSKPDSSKKPISDKETQS